GFRAVIAQSFAEIFFGNCATLGMPCVAATAEDIERLAAAIGANPDLEVTIDVEKNRVFFGDENFTVHIPDSARDGFLAGQWDPIGELLEGEAAIAETAGKLPYFAAR
ncbi:MAG: isopropylmalate isomerase, partial [Verrucomicrobiae bacterium]|nr:isopropylmalate isomerase [Verrucomicrobiae bacterium]